MGKSSGLLLMATNDPKPLTGCPDRTKLELDRMTTFSGSLDKARILCSAGA